MKPAPVDKLTTHEPGVYFNSKGKKTFIPLENNPQVFIELAQKLDVSPELGFYDVYSIDEPDLLAIVPRPVHALIFIVAADVYHRVRAEDPGSKELTYDKSGDDEPVIWFKQTIGHACGLIAFLHSLFNGTTRQFIPANSTLDSILRDAIPKKPWDRADVLYNSAELENAHMSVARKGDSVAPEAEEPNGYHFISFVKGKDGHLYELEGSWDGPIDRGLLEEGEDCLGEKPLELGVRRFVRQAQEGVEFGIVAVATKPEGEE